MKTHEKKDCFATEEARAKVGRRVITTIDFSGVPKGTQGRVLEPYPGDYTPEGEQIRSIPIEWDLPQRRAKPLVDWFTKEEYERWLKEVDNPL